MLDPEEILQRIKCNPQRGIAMRTLSDSTQKYKASLMLDPGEVIEGIADNPDRGEAKPFLSDSTQKYRKIYKKLNENPEAEFDLLLKMDPDDRAFFFWFNIFDKLSKS